MMNEDLLAYQQQVLSASKEQMDQGRQQLDVGQILESDYKMLQAQYTSDLYSLENTRHNIESNYLTLKNLLSIDPTRDIAIGRPDSATLFKNLELPVLQELIDRSTHYLPELKMSENEITNAEYDVKIQKAGFYPTLSANAGISTGYNGANQTSPNTGWGTQLWHGLGENLGLRCLALRQLQHRHTRSHTPRSRDARLRRADPRPPHPDPAQRQRHLQREGTPHRRFHEDPQRNRRTQPKTPDEAKII